MFWWYSGTSSGAHASRAGSRSTAGSCRVTVYYSQAANVDRLLTMLCTLDPAKDSIFDNKEIQELYRSCMFIRPKIVKLINE